VKDTSIAARYARALLIVTEKRGETVRALEDLKGLLEVLKPGSRAGNFFTSPGAPLADKREALKRVFDGKALKADVLFVDLLLRKKRLGLFPQIVAEFEALVEKQQGIQRAHVTSTVPLSDAETERLLKALESSTGSKIRLTTAIDARLLGGAQVRIRDRVLDRSVRTLLDTIEQHLREVAV